MGRAGNVSNAPQVNGPKPSNDGGLFHGLRRIIDNYPDTEGPSVFLKWTTNH